MKLIRRLSRPLLIVLGVPMMAHIVARRIARPAHPWFAARPGQHTPLVFAHQGGENLWPSHTLLAF